MPKFMCVKDANSSQLREIWKTTAILSTELLKNHTTENHRCLWDNPAQLSTYIMDPELIWALCVAKDHPPEQPDHVRPPVVGDQHAGRHLGTGYHHMRALGCFENNFFMIQDLSRGRSSDGQNENSFGDAFSSVIRGKNMV